MQKVTNNPGGVAGTQQQQGQCVQVSQAMIGSQPTAQIISPLQVGVRIQDLKAVLIEFSFRSLVDNRCSFRLGSLTVFLKFGPLTVCSLKPCWLPIRFSSEAPSLMARGCLSSKRPKLPRFKRNKIVRLRF